MDSCWPCRRKGSALRLFRAWDGSAMTLKAVILSRGPAFAGARGRSFMYKGQRGDSTLNRSLVGFDAKRRARLENFWPEVA